MGPRIHQWGFTLDKAKYTLTYELKVYFPINVRNQCKLLERQIANSSVYGTEGKLEKW